jgi:endonuclease/exonuclease/phosphatase family metal-dependent hydrolase
MPGKYKKVFLRTFLFFHILTALGFLGACAAPLLNPGKWWFISLLGLGFALLLGLLILFLLFWVIVKPRYILISLIPLLIGVKSITAMFAFHAPDDFNYGKQKSVLRVASWNVARFIEWKRNNNKGSQKRIKMFELLKAQNADVLCLQEFFHSTDSVYYDNLRVVMKQLGYPYYYFSWDDDGWLQWNGQAIFSRYPIIDSGLVRYPKPGQTESLIHADIKWNNDTIRVYTTHLQSVQFKQQDYESINEIKNREDSILENSRNIFSKLKRAVIFRSRQADIVAEITGNSPYPFILTGDFNDVPNSYTYFTIRKNLQDAFLKNGFGIGRTYSTLAPTLRIDYILATREFTIPQFNRIVKDYSDHYLLVADLRLKK